MKKDSTNNSADDAWVEQILAALSFSEKVAMCHAKSVFRASGVPRLGLGDLVMSDGPHGVRAEVDPEYPDQEIDDRTTYLPVEIALAATWNPERAADFGHVLGREARARGKDIILGPGVNLQRTPLNGRNFEYLGEDPHLTARLAVALIKAVQQHNVAACIKHFALNNQEWGRLGLDVHCDEQSLRELYLPAFEAAVKEAGVLSVMGGYNRFRGQYCCHHGYLIDQILRREWKFRGLLVSDWGGVQDGDEAVFHELDLEMGGDLNNLHLPRALLAARDAKCDPTIWLDQKIRHILYLRRKVKKGCPDRSRGERNSERHQQLARRIAEESMVLLKNQGPLLPLAIDQIKTIALIGDNAAALHGHGGGSAGIKPFREITPLQALREFLPPGVRIVHQPGYPVTPAGMQDIPPELLAAADHAGIGGWRREIFANRDGKGEPWRVEVVPKVDFSCSTSPSPELHPKTWSITWSAVVNPRQSGSYKLVFRAGSYCQVTVDRQLIFQTRDVTRPVVATHTVEMVAGRGYKINLRIMPKQAGGSITFGWIPPGVDDSIATSDRFQEAIKAAKIADAVIFCGGSNHFQDCEGLDRGSYSLSDGQDQLIPQILAANPRTVICLTGGSPVALPWLDQAPVVVQNWYAGAEGGRALVDLLFGQINFSGRLPFSWPRCWQDVAAHCLGDYNPTRTVYREGWRTGYRWHNGEGPPPLFPFGHGLSYSEFKYHELRLKLIDQEPGQINLLATCLLTNTGHRAGAEVAQLYLSPENSNPGRPPLQLKAWNKCFLEAGQTRKISFKLNQRDLSGYCPNRRQWVVEAGSYLVRIGSSSLDLRLEKAFKLNN